jgi:phenylpropionate dioxygenase-like ring-hydroxylating dioxygenase large terminal subunit
MTVACNYLFLTDNLLDPSHVAWVHGDSFGDAACEDEPVHATVSANGVVAHRWMHNVDVAPFYAPLVRFTGQCDRLQHYEVRYPSHCVVKAVLSPCGTGGAGTPLHPDAMVMHSYNFMTPIDADHTRYFWFQTRNFCPGDESVSKLMDDAVRAVFAEDRVILEAVHEGFRNHVAPKIDLAIDRAPLLFRWRLERLIAAEHTPSPAAG